MCLPVPVSTLYVSWKECAGSTLKKCLNVEEQFAVLRKEFFLSFILCSNREIEVPAFEEHKVMQQP